MHASIPAWLRLVVAALVVVLAAATGACLHPGSCEVCEGTPPLGMLTIARGVLARLVRVCARPVAAFPRLSSPLRNRTDDVVAAFPVSAAAAPLRI